MRVPNRQLAHHHYPRASGRRTPPRTPFPLRTACHGEPLLDDGLTEYERQRLAHVARNREYMARLGIQALAGEIAGPRIPNRRSAPPREGEARARGGRATQRARSQHGPRVRRRRGGRPLRRRGRRLEREAPQGGSRLRFARIATGPAGVGVWASEDAALEASRQWLEDARELMLARVAASDVAGAKKLNNDDAKWREEAARRWGDGVPAAELVSDWRAWTTSRIGTPPPPSDLQLLQEYYAHDAWQLLVACVLMSRVSSWATKHECISKFFQAFPTPTARSPPSRTPSSPSSNPWVCFPNRYRSLVEVSARVLTETGPLDVGLEPGVNKIYGVGEFGVDSFDVFCRGDLSRTPGDKTLQSFVAWQKRRGNYQKPKK